MNTENTNNFSKCKIGDKLWCIQLGDCVVNELTRGGIFVVSDNGYHACFFFDGKFRSVDEFQSLYFSNPDIVAPPEPPRLPIYKPGQIIAVWDNDLEVPYLRKFKEFQDGKIRVYSEGSLHNTEFGWPNYCTLEELPAVLKKIGEIK